MFIIGYKYINVLMLLWWCLEYRVSFSDENHLMWFLFEDEWPKQIVLEKKKKLLGNSSMAAINTKIPHSFFDYIL